MSKIINPTDKASLWELIGFPLGFIAGVTASVVITIIIKGKECLA